MTQREIQQIEQILLPEKPVDLSHLMEPKNDGPDDETYQTNK